MKIGHLYQDYVITWTFSLAEKLVQVFPSILLCPYAVCCDFSCVPVQVCCCCCEKTPRKARMNTNLLKLGVLPFLCDLSLHSGPTDHCPGPAQHRKGRPCSAKDTLGQVAAGGSGGLKACLDLGICKASDPLQDPWAQPWCLPSLPARTWWCLLFPVQKLQLHQGECTIWGACVSSSRKIHLESPSKVKRIPESCALCSGGTAGTKKDDTLIGFKAPLCNLIPSKCWHLLFSDGLYLHCLNHLSG